MMKAVAIGERKMKMFMWTLLFVFFFMLMAFVMKIQFNGEQFMYMFGLFLIWVALMAGANVGEYFGKAFMEKAKNITPKKIE